MAKSCGLANQKFCYFYMVLDIDQSGEQDEEQLDNTEPGRSLFYKVSKIMQISQQELDSRKTMKINVINVHRLTISFYCAFRLHQNDEALV